MKWEPLRLAQRTAGAEYGASTVRVADLLGKLSSNVSKDSRPAVVWLYRPDQPDANDAIESTVMQNEQVGIALRMFRCYRVNVLDIQDERIRKEYEDTPSFHFFDPAGEELIRIDSRKADSLSTFDDVVEKVWRKSFKTRLRNFQREFTRMLDQLDKLDGQKQILEQDKARLAEKPNPRKARQLEQEEKELEKMAQEIEKQEEELFASIELRPDYLPADSDKVAEK